MNIFPVLFPHTFFRFPALFSYYSSSTVVQEPWLPEVTEGHLTPKGSLKGCAHAQPPVARLRNIHYSGAFSLEMTSSNVATGSCAICDQPSSVGFPWKSRDGKCPWGVL